MHSRISISLMAPSIFVAAAILFQASSLEAAQGRAGAARKETTEKSVGVAEPTTDTVAIMARGLEALDAGGLGDWSDVIELHVVKLKVFASEGREESWRAMEEASRLLHDLEDAPGNPHPLASFRGQREWVYRSKADGTIQPFNLWIPKSYDPENAYPIYVNLHGAGGSHYPMNDRGDSDSFLLQTLGRGRTEWYVGLAEIDVLESLAFVRAHWNIDPRRIHLQGASMGGGGSFLIGSRHPDLFASARPICGYIARGTHSQAAVENMLHVATHSIHSVDDGLVPVFMSRVAVDRINRFGGTAIQDETDGLGHAAWGHQKGQERASAWFRDLRAPKEVRRVHYVATDELARGAYWIEVVEWGPQGRPATVDARIDAGNTLRLNIDNAAVVRIDLSASPADNGEALTLIVNSSYIDRIEGPLPEALYVSREGDSWKFSESVPEMPVERLHFPGGAKALFHGEPILVVWGTHGDEAMNEKLRGAGEAARLSASSRWARIQYTRKDKEGGFMMYGRLPGKPDREVTDEDIQNNNLLLIGTAEQNSVVAQLADRLPARIEEGRIKTSDGFEWDFEGRSLGLLYYNPDAPKRLIYWAASESADFYRAGTPMMDSQSRAVAPPDFIVMGLDKAQRVAARRFDSRWNFEPGYGESPLLPEAFGMVDVYAEAAAKGVRHAAGADFAIACHDTPTTGTSRCAIGETRLDDLAAWEYGNRLGVFELNGTQLLEAAAILAVRESESGKPRRFVPTPIEKNIVPNQVYRIGATHETMSRYVGCVRENPRSFRLIERTNREAVMLIPMADSMSPFLR